MHVIYRFDIYWCKISNKIFFLFLIHLFVGFEKIAQMLIKKGTDVNVVNTNKYSALTYAVTNGNISTEFIILFF